MLSVETKIIMVMVMMMMKMTMVMVMMVMVMVVMVMMVMVMMVMMAMMTTVCISMLQFIVLLNASRGLAGLFIASSLQSTISQFSSSTLFL